MVVHFANPDARDPYTAGAVQRRGGASVEMTPAFLGEARVVALPFAPDFFGAGDFDDDGRADVLVASKGSSTFAVFPGDGAGALSWTNAQCGFGATGQPLFNPGVPAAGKFLYWVAVGQTFSLEGSYGQNSSGVERPEAVGLFVCELPQSLAGPCP